MKFIYVVDRILRIMDGDTLEIQLDLGFKINYNVTVRVLGVDAPEKKHKLANETVKKAISLWLEKADNLSLESHEWDKYGRVLGDIKASNRKLSLSTFLIDNKLVKKYDGGKKKEWLEVELSSVTSIVPIIL
jgi:micrococcal nuclease